MFCTLPKSRRETWKDEKPGKNINPRNGKPGEKIGPWDGKPGEKTDGIGNLENKNLLDGKPVEKIPPWDGKSSREKMELNMRHGFYIV